MFNSNTVAVEPARSIIVDLDFTLNAFRKQKVYTDAEAYGRMTRRLLFMRKGDFISDPNMGIGISSYRFRDMDHLLAGTLRDDIFTQCNTYIRGIRTEDVVISKTKYQGDFILFIDIKASVPVIGKVTHALVQRNSSIIKSQLKIEKPRVINPYDE